MVYLYVGFYVINYLMGFFTSKKERNFWIIALITTMVILSTLFIGRPLLDLLEDQNVRAIFFASGMLLVAITIALHAFFSQTTKIEIALIIGIAAIYLMFFLRLGMAERSHIIEFSVLAIAIHKALIERNKNGALKYATSWLAISITFFIGLIDECLQLFIPDRHFDPNDIVFNLIVIVTAVGFYILIAWIRGLIKNKANTASK